MYINHLSHLKTPFGWVSQQPILQPGKHSAGGGGGGGGGGGECCYKSWKTTTQDSTLSAAQFNPMYTGTVFRCHVLEESICQFRDVESILLLNSVSIQCRPKSDATSCGICSGSALFA